MPRSPDNSTEPITSINKNSTDASGVYMKMETGVYMKKQKSNDAYLRKQKTNKTLESRVVVSKEAIQNHCRSLF